jgi:HEAT repeat protein
MRSVSAQTKALVDLLNSPIGVWEKISGGRNDRELLTQISDAGEPAAIVYITPFVLSEKRELAGAAVAAVERLFAAVPPEDLARLDVTFRMRSPYVGRYSMKWHSLKPADVKKLEGLGSDSVALLGLASFHSSGYVREEAIKRLNQRSGGAELPLLLIRLNDWVLHVRAAAQRAVMSRLSPYQASRFVTNLALLPRLKQTERSDHRPVVEAIENLLKNTECREALLQGLKSSSRLIRRSSFKLAVDATEADTMSILERALDDADTIIRLWAARRIAAELDGQNLNKLLALMRGDHFMPVRREALRAVLGRVPDQALVELRLALLDPHVSMREEGRYELRKREEIDFAAFYRQALSSAGESELTTVISGVGESGAARDDSLLIPYTLHKSGKVRKAAIKAMSRLNGGAHLAVFINALQDEVPGVSREGQRALARKVTLVGGESLWEVFNATRYPFVRRNALYLLTLLGKWDSICFLIKATGDSDEEIASNVRLYIDRWLRQFNRRFTAPTGEQLTRLRQALEENAYLFDGNLLEQLWFSMKGF